MNELNEDEKKYQIALTLIEGVGDVIAKKLLAFTSSAKAVFLRNGVNWDVKDF